MYDIFKYIIKLHPYCSIDEGELTQDYFHNIPLKPRIVDILTFLIQDLRNPFIYTIDVKRIKDEIDSIYLTSKRRDLIKTRLGVELPPDAVKNKYLKYKQKYNSLKLLKNGS